jgi:hypothetical protein
MANTELVRLADDAPREKIIGALNALVDASLGNIGARVLMVGHDGTSADPNTNASTGTGLYQTVVRSNGANHLQVQHSSGTPDMLAVTDSAAVVQALVVTTTSLFSGTATFDAPLVANGAVTLGNAAADALTVNATGTYAAPQTFNDNVTLGNAAGDVLTVNATTTFTAPVTGNGTVQFKTPLSAPASASLSLTTTPTNVVGCTMSLTPGKWLVTGVFDFSGIGAGDVGQALLGSLATSGGTATVANATSVAVLSVPIDGTRATVVQAWLVTVTATTTATLQGSKTGGAGASIAVLTHTAMMATNA